LFREVGSGKYLDMNKRKPDQGIRLPFMFGDLYVFWVSLYFLDLVGNSSSQ